MKIFLKEFYSLSLIVYLLFLVTEFLVPGSVSDFFNFNIILGILFLTGLILFFLEREALYRMSDPDTLSHGRFYWPFLMAIATGVLVYFKAQPNEWAEIIAIFSSLFAFLVTFLLLP
jgi:hypothetical protein